MKIPIESGRLTFGDIWSSYHFEKEASTKFAWTGQVHAKQFTYDLTDIVNHPISIDLDMINNALLMKKNLLSIRLAVTFTSINPSWVTESPTWLIWIICCLPLYTSRLEMLQLSNWLYVCGCCVTLWVMTALTIK